MTRAVVYARISHDDAEDQHGVNNQEKEAVKYATDRGWPIVRRFVDNDISASNGKFREQYEALMAAAARREFDAIVVFHTSRLWRNRKERAHAIDVLKDAAVSVVAVKGPSLDMSTAYGRGMAGLLGEFDSMEVEVKAERQKLANQSAAKNGHRWVTCHRPFGYRVEMVPDRTRRSGYRRVFVIEPAEADAIRWAAGALLGGSTVASVVREWEARGLKPVQGAEHWRSSSVRKILGNPRLAGLAWYLGEAVTLDDGAEPDWPAILDESVWRAVHQLLDDPARKPPRGVRTLLGGLARCRCGNIALATGNGSGQHIYRCSPPTRDGKEGPHATVRLEPADEFVETAILARLARPDIADLLQPPAHVDAVALRAEATAIRQNLDALAADAITAGYTRSMLTAATQRAKSRLDEIAAELAQSAEASVLAPFVAGQKAAEVWAGLELARKRAVIGTLCKIKLKRAERRGGPFDSEQVVINWTEPG